MVRVVVNLAFLLSAEASGPRIGVEPRSGIQCEHSAVSWVDRDDGHGRLIDTDIVDDFLQPRIERQVEVFPRDGGDLSVRAEELLGDIKRLGVSSQSGCAAENGFETAF